MSVKRYRITADFYASEVAMTDRWVTEIEELIRQLLLLLHPLGVVEGYPDIQEIAQDSPFVAADETHD